MHREFKMMVPKITCTHTPRGGKEIQEDLDVDVEQKTNLTSEPQNRLQISHSS